MSNLKVGAVILSRFSSSRLPGKALMEIEGKAVLEYIIERLLVVLSLENIIIATSIEDSDNPIAAFAKSKNVACYRGSLENVAHRFYEAADSQKMDYAIRINGDNIFVDTQVLSKMIKIAEENKYDFISNVKNRTFPKGMSVEIVKTNFFKQQLNKINESREFREHVTLYFYENENEVKTYFYYNTDLPESAGIQFALDTQEDFDRTTSIISRFQTAHYNYNMKEIFIIYSQLLA